MKTDPAAGGAFASLLSWGALFLSLAILALLGWYIPRDRAHFLTLFQDFHLRLPASTQFIFAIPDLAFPIAAGLVGLVAFSLQRLVHSKSNLAIFHMFTIVCCCAFFLIYRESMYQPMSMLIEGISAPSGGR